MSVAVGGLAPLTTIDFPGRLAAVVFLQGCPWACGYCHNPHLLPARGAAPGDWEGVRAFLGRRRGLLDGVVFSGGEPTRQEGLADALREVRALGFQTGLHTSGAFPGRLREVLPLLDWVGMDLKAPFDAYDAVTGVPASGAKARESAGLLAAGGVAHEFRTTVHPLLHSEESLLRLAEDLRALGARRWFLQEFRREGCADAAFAAADASALPGPELAERLRGMFAAFGVRPA